MKKCVIFWCKASLVLVIVIGFFFGVLMPQYTQGFTAALLDKVDRLTSIQGPKIVLIGNSNLVFGIDSAKIEEEFGLPVVNMGLHGGLGNAFHEETALCNVQPGDIYIVAHTEYDDDDQITDPSLAWITIENHFSLWRFLRVKDIPGMVDAFSTYIKKALALWAEGVGNEADLPMYARKEFNVYGDNTYPRPSRDVLMEVPFEEQTLPEIGEACVKRLNALNAALQEKGATMLVAAYPIASGEFTPLVAEYDAFTEALTEALDAPVISYFSDYMLDYEYFYDTLYHLTNAGVEIRTNLLIDDIHYWMVERGIESLR